jgi:hypothetical protein
MEGNNMTQITSIKLGLIAICFATVPLSLAQTPRIGTSRSNQIGATIGATAGHSGLSGNSTSAGQLGTNFRSITITAPNTNAGAHIGINAGAQTGISNPTGGIIGGPAAGLSGLSGNSTSAAQLGANFRSSTITAPNTNVGAHIGIHAASQTGISNQTGRITGGAAAGLGSSSSNSMGAAQIGTNARTGTNTTGNTNAGAHTAAAAATPARVTTIQPQLIPVPINGPSPNNSPIGPTFSTPAEFPSPSVTPTPTPAQLL